MSEEELDLFWLVDEDSCARLRLAMEMSSFAMKPEGVRVDFEEEAVASAARERSRRALALRRFSSWGVVRILRERTDASTYDPTGDFWCRR